MRACFLGQNVCALGNGVAMLQSPPLVAYDPLEEERNQVPGRPVARNRKAEKQRPKDSP